MTLESASLEPGHRFEHEWRDQAMSRANRMFPDPLERLSRPVSDFLHADEQNEVAQRALVQIFAIRSWQLKHDGRVPRSSRRAGSRRASQPSDRSVLRPAVWLSSLERRDELISLRSATLSQCDACPSRLEAHFAPARIVAALQRRARSTGQRRNCHRGRDAISACSAATTSSSRFRRCGPRPMETSRRRNPKATSEPAKPR